MRPPLLLLILSLAWEPGLAAAAETAKGATPAGAPATPAVSATPVTAPATTASSAAVGAASPARATTPAGVTAPDDGDGDDEPEPSEEVDAESAELEAVRALEEAALNPRAKPAARVLQTVSRLGVATPLRARMEDAFEDDIYREDAFYELGLITDLASFDVNRVRDEYDIPIEMQPLVAQYIEFFQGAGRKWFRKWMGRSRRYIPLLQPVLVENGVPKDTVYLAMIESGFSPQAYSRAKAAGMWQFISSTGKRYGLRQDFWVDERRDFMKATGAAAKYLKALRGDLGHWYLAWAGYNAGGGRVQRTIDRLGTKDFWELSSGRGLAKETQHYVPKLIACALVAKHPAAFGFQETEFDSQTPFQFEEVQLADPIDLDLVARAAHVPLDEVKELNPELKRWCTPPATTAKPYTLRLPKGSKAAFTENIAKIAPRERLTFMVHRVKRGDTLSQIARSYHSAPEPILQLNHLRSARRLRVNTEIVIPVPRGRQESSAALEHQVESARRHGFVASREEEEVPAGTPHGSVKPGEVVTEDVNGKTRITYTVQDGDSLWTIGQRFGVSVDQLRGWNGIGRKAGLQIGAKVVLYPKPGAGTAGAPASATATSASSTPAPSPARSASATAIPASAGTSTSVPAVNTGTAPGVTPGASASASSVTPGTSASAATTGSTTTPPLPPGERPRVHVLGEGETLWAVSQRYGIPVEKLLRWNNIKHAKNLRPGQQLSLVAP